MWRRRGPASTVGVETNPDRIRQGREEIGMRGELLRGRRVRPRRPDLDRDSRRIRLADLPADRHRDDLIEPEADLPAAGQLDIALGEKLGIDQRAMLDTQAAIDSEAGAERVEAVLGARMPGTGELERIDHPAEAD